MLHTSEKEPSVIFTGAFRFPDKDAAAQRVFNLARTLKKGNMNSIFCGWENSSRSEDLQANGTYTYHGFEYYSQAELDSGSRNIFNRIYGFLVKGNKTIRWIKSYLKDHKISFIVIYNSNSLFIYRLLSLSRKSNFQVVCDCTEWYDGSHLPGGRFGIVNLDNNFRIRFIYPFVRNIIVISSYLEEYLKRNGCNTLMVPPLVDLADKKWNSMIHNEKFESQSTIKLIYAGDPGNKDLLRSIFMALEFINENSIRIDFYIVGTDPVVLKNKYFKNFKVIPEYIKCIGRIPQENVPDYYHLCHFSILLRENKRYSQAGFPTKLVESLSSGIPVITNCTSDIPKYIVDGENGFLLNGTSHIELIQCFYKILLLSKNEIEIMKVKAKQSSRENFDLNLFMNPLKNYFANLK
jgi:glycosyltransferase involved in cell wall biosynthesis